MSILDRATEYLKRNASPFIRLKLTNPRYEKVNFCLDVRFLPGRDEIFFKDKLKNDLREFLAPWAVGKYDKLSFGQAIHRSDIIRFIEQTGYVDFINGIKMTHENEPLLLIDTPTVLPVTPRSVLIAGDIDVLIDPQRCDDWCRQGINN
ncbi:MAG: hypothetical protein H7Y27_11020 [Gemmatimonadaceae bacterium]|nr:hypothetical protein [Chitinophagaceae bacterium]